MDGYSAQMMVAGIQPERDTNRGKARLRAAAHMHPTHYDINQDVSLHGLVQQHIDPSLSMEEQWTQLMLQQSGELIDDAWAPSEPSALMQPLWTDHNDDGSINPWGVFGKTNA